MRKHIMEEAKRCLGCKVPKCRESCPVGTPVNEMIALLLEGNLREAGKRLFENNPLSAVCSLVCPHELQCEGNCVLGKKGDSVHVSAIEHYISDFYLNLLNYKPKKDKDKKVAIIGTGPAGITIAFNLALKGYAVTLFEAHDRIGGVLRYGIPEFRLPKSILERLMDKLIEVGVQIRPNTNIGSTITMEDLFRDGYKAAFIGIGVWKPGKLNIKGESLGHVHYAIDYLKNPEVYQLGSRVCIIGAGNVAMDVARTAIRKGAEKVSVMYRKGEMDITALRHEVEYAKAEGVKFEFFKSPVEITDHGVIYCKTELNEDFQGEDNVMEIPRTEALFPADSVIIAVGQGPKTTMIANTKGIDISSSGLIITDEFGRTNRKGVFASGDIVTGAKTVVEAVRRSKMVAEAIDEYVTTV